MSGKTAPNSNTRSEKGFQVPTTLYITKGMVRPYKWTRSFVIGEETNLENFRWVFIPCGTTIMPSYVFQSYECALKKKKKRKLCSSSSLPVLFWGRRGWQKDLMELRYFFPYHLADFGNELGQLVRGKVSFKVIFFFLIITSERLSQDIFFGSYERFLKWEELTLKNQQVWRRRKQHISK